MSVKSSLGRQVHQAIWLLLPWHVNGTLGLFHSLRVRWHLRGCRACRDEVALQTSLRNAVQRTSVNSAAGPAFEKFKARIQADIERSDANGALSESGRSVSGAWRGLAPYARRRGAWSAAVALLVLALSRPLLEHDTAAPVHVFRTAASPSSNAVFQPNDVRVVFARPLNPEAIQVLIAPIDGQIVGGPTDAGVYTVRIGVSGASREVVAERIERLRVSADVALAEPAIPWGSVNPR